MLKTVLSIDADGNAYKTRNAALAAAGYTVIPACGFKQGLAAVRNFRFDALVVGCRIEIIEKAALISLAKTHHPFTPVIVLYDNQHLKPFRTADAHILSMDGAGVVLEQLAELLARNRGFKARKNTDEEQCVSLQANDR